MPTSISRKHPVHKHANGRVVLRRVVEVIVPTALEDDELGAPSAEWVALVQQPRLEEWHLRSGRSEEIRAIRGDHAKSGEIRGD